MSDSMTDSEKDKFYLPFSVYSWDINNILIMYRILFCSSHIDTIVLYENIRFVLFVLFLHPTEYVRIPERTTYCADFQLIMALTLVLYYFL